MQTFAFIFNLASGGEGIVVVDWLFMGKYEYLHKKTSAT